MLPKQHRLVSAKDFQRTLKKGRRLTGQFVTIRLESISPSKPTQIGFIVSTKISKKATDRNRIKRLLRENIRTEFLPNFRKPFQAVVIARQNIIDKDFWQINADLKKIFIKNKII